jgi:hypothetical protein
MHETKNQGFQVVTLGAVKADGTPDIANILFSFPVPHQQMSVKQEVKIDEVDVPGRSGKVKQAVGYEDTEVGLTLTLVDREDRSGAVVYSALDQLKELQAAFRDRSDPVGEAGTNPKAAPRGVPTIFSIQSRLTDACGIKTVLFKGLEVNELSGDTALEVSITFIEFEPVARQIERRAREQVQKQAAVQEAKEAIGYDDSAASEAHDEEAGEESPLAAAFRQGKADAMGGMPE